MSAARYDFTAENNGSACEQNASFGPVLTWTDQAGDPVDLTHYTAKLQVRAAAGADVVLELSTDNGKITLGGLAGTITLVLTPAQTAALTAGTYVYDLLVKDSSGVVTRLLEGEFEIKPGITVMS